MISRGEPDDDPGLTKAAAYADRVAGGAPREVFSPRQAAVDQVRVYAIEQPPGWHLVTLGLADLGFELTLRLALDDQVPTWAVDFLLSLGAYARRSGHGFAGGHHIDLRGPMKLESETGITAAAVAADPTLGVLGEVEFLQVVGLTADELELCRSWRTEAVVGLLRRSDPLLTTLLDRASLLDDPQLREAAEAGVAAEGSSLDELHVASLAVRWRRRGGGVVVTLGAGAATALGPALRRKLTHVGGAFSVVGDSAEVGFEVAPAAGWRADGDNIVVSVPQASVEELAALFDGRTGTGSLPSLPGLRFTVIS